MSAFRSRRMLAAALALAWFAPPALAQPAPPCDVAGCVELALAHSPQIKSRAAELDASRHARAQATANYGPRLLVDGGVQVWNEAIVSSFGDIPGLPIDIEPVSFEVRPQVTWNLSITLAQPLSRLWTIYEAAQLAEMGVDVARIERETARRQVALETVRAWLQAATARELIGVLEASLTSRTSDVERVQVLLDAGVVARTELLRAQLGRADAQQRLSETQGQLTVALAQLSARVGVPVTPRPLPDVDPDATALPAPPSVDDAVASALTGRLELDALQRRVAQARGAVDVAQSELLPRLDLVAAAQFANASDLQPSDSYFIGLNLSWTAWQWLGNYRRIDEARARARAADFQLDALREGVAVEVQAAHAKAEAARARWAVAREAVGIAEENYRIVQTQQSAQVATSFDVLDAETALTQARADARVSRANYLLARAELAYAMGGDPGAIALGGSSL